MTAAPPGRRGPAPPSTKAAADDEATAPDLHRLTQWVGSEKPRHLPIVLHPRLSRPLPPPPRPARPATFWDVPQDVLRLVAAELAAHGSARDMCAFEGVCVATRCARGQGGRVRAGDGGEREREGGAGARKTSHAPNDRRKAQL